ncbi:CsbD-like protein [Corynebacterium capitovis DSM 44611]|uniref:CsbD family protein n=1 Tax=Corynebacterium capitovis TaxID=131081 RepID=UPI00037759B9|nr:CsbD family protein [Corynebacterium capitovis]WKD56671.1 CsbD-like protein [Corynebacterium capitovis DSM 44611]
MAFEGKADQIKGGAKEALGDVTDNRNLENEGKADQLGGDIKEKVAGARDAIKDKANEVAGKIQDKRDEN